MRRMFGTGTFTTQLDWRIWLGLVLTTVYLAYGLYHITVDIGWRDFSGQSLESQGSFLEGAFAPLAFLWLVVGYFLQHKALQENNRNIELQYRAMRQTAQHAAVQAGAIAASERHSRVEGFLNSLELVNGQLAATAGLLFMANQRGTGPIVGPTSELWSRVGAGDSGVFARLLLDLCHTTAGRRLDGWRVFFGTTARRRQTQAFVATFDNVLATARACDNNGLLVDALIQGTAHGHLYRVIKDYELERRVELVTQGASDHAA